MLSALASLMVAVAPVAPAGTQVALVIPQPRVGLPALHAFLEKAGAFAPTLAPGPLGLELASAISTDLFEVAAWEASGLDLDAPMTLASKGDEAVLVLGVKDAKQVAARAQAGLGSFGTVAPGKLRGGQLWEARRPGAAAPDLAGAVGIRGKWAALLVRGASDRWALTALEARPFKALEQAKGLAGDAFVVSLGERGPTTVIGLAAGADQLGLDARVSAPGGVVKLAARDAFQSPPPAGLLWANADLTGWALTSAKGELAAWVRFLTLQVCRDCSTRPEELLGATLAGPVAVLVTRLAPDQSRSSGDLDRYFLVPEVEAAQVRDPVAAHAALTALLDELRSHHAAAETLALPHGENYQLRLGAQRAVYFGMVGSTLYLANAADARDALLAALPEVPASPSHAGRVHLDGNGLAQALAKLSVFDAAASNDLASLFGIAVEVNPLLRSLGECDLSIEAEAASARVRGTLHLATPAAPHP